MGRPAPVTQANTGQWVSLLHGTEVSTAPMHEEDPALPLTFLIYRQDLELQVSDPERRRLTLHAVPMGPLFNPTPSTGPGSPCRHACGGSVLPHPHPLPPHSLAPGERR